MERLILGVEALRFLEREGLRVLKSSLVQDEEEAVIAAKEIGFPVALKLLSPEVIHKTEAEGVRVDLRNEREVRKAHRRLIETFHTSRPEGELEGVMIQEMGEGTEVIVGALLDPHFGPVIMFGLGGIFVEALRDVSFRIIPIEKKDAQDMIREIKGFPILQGIRGEDRGVDLRSLEDLLLNISNLIERHPTILEMDINPAFACPEGYAICDARIRIRS
ncbi:MAG: acetate--CoA ligase family protein [Anaerolineae bacterium]